MLVRFKLSNFCSFKDEVEFSLTPTKEKLRRRRHLYNPASPSGRELLRLAVIYGANASGKSNFIKAFEFVEKLVSKGVRPNKSTGVQPFKLDKACKKSPSRFYFELLLSGSIYSYEIHITNDAIQYEKLAELTKSTEKLLYERVFDGEESKYFFAGVVEKLDKERLQLIKFVASGTRKNQLFLTETIERNIDLFKEVYEWFNSGIRILSPNSIGHGIEFRLGSDKQFRMFLLQMLSYFDPSIANVRTNLIEAENSQDIPQRVLKDIDDEIDEEGAVVIANYVNGNRSVVVKRDGVLMLLKMLIIRKYLDNKEEIKFDLEEESDGTRRLIDLAPLFYELLYSEEPVIAFIDELDRSLHPLLTKGLIELFMRISSERNSQSQIIISTHNSVLLDLKLLRKDEIWIIDKNECVSEIKSLQRNFSPRYDRDIRKDYLDGEYGGIPFTKFSPKQGSLF